MTLNESFTHAWFCNLQNWLCKHWFPATVLMCCKAQQFYPWKEKLSIFLLPTYFWLPKYMGSFLIPGSSQTPPGGPTIQLASDTFCLGVASDPTGLIPTGLSLLQTPITSSDCRLCVCWPSPCVCICSGAQSCLTLCNPMEYSTPASSVHGIFHVRILGWVAVSYCRTSSWSRDRNFLSCISWTGRDSTTWKTGRSP